MLLGFAGTIFKLERPDVELHAVVTAGNSCPIRSARLAVGAYEPVTVPVPGGLGSLMASRLPDPVLIRMVVKPTFDWLMVPDGNQETSPSTLALLKWITSNGGEEVGAANQLAHALAPAACAVMPLAT